MVIGGDLGLTLGFVREDHNTRSTSTNIVAAATTSASADLIPIHSISADSNYVITNISKPDNMVTASTPIAYTATYYDHHEFLGHPAAPMTHTAGRQYPNQIIMGFILLSTSLPYAM